jgi:GT2 family glycosyltransferase
MQPRVTAVLVARNGGKYLPRTLAAIAAQTRRPDSVLFVDTASSDDSAAILRAAADGQPITTPGRRSFGGAVAHAVHVGPPQGSDNEWLWLLGHDNAPQPDALAGLLGAVEVAPSVAVAGPKLMQWDDVAVIASYGETLTRFGRSLPLVSHELDQAQYDLGSDLLGVAAGGMLVRRQVWSALGGFDPALSSVDAALDFCIRARIAGHRVVGVPAARVASAGPPELFGRRSLSVGAQNRIRRFAQLHRRLVYSPPAALPLHWLSLVPLAVLRSLAHLAAKRPGSVGGEFAAAIGAAFDTTVPTARRTLRRNRVLGWASIGALRISWSEVRERRAHERSVAAAAAGGVVRDRPGFFAAGGAWVVLLAAVVGVIAFGRFSDAPALTGGGIVPLSTTVGELWAHVGYGWRDVGSGFLGAADPFSYLLALLGTLTFWAPSFSVVALYLAALPLAALGAWFCAAHFSVRPWAPAIAALAWSLAPPFLVSLGEGHLGAVIAHILLPSLVLAVVTAARSWSAAALAALLFAAVAASAPILVPALLVGLVAWILARPTRVLKLIGIPIPAAALFAPLAVQQFARGNWLALFADPGVAAGGSAPAGWQLALGNSQPGLGGWEGFLASLGLAPHLAPVVVTVLLAPFAVLALLALFLPGARRSVPAMLVALLGFVTALVGAHLHVTLVGSQSIPIWPGAALSLYWLGLVGATVVALEALARVAAIPALVAVLGLVAVAVPSLTAAAGATTTVVESNGRLLPAFASAEAATRPWLGTLQLTAQTDGGVGATVHRGQGTTLDERSTLAQTDTQSSPADARLAVLAGNLASRSGFDIAAELDALQVAFVLLPDANGDAAEARQRVADALDGNRLLTPVGSTAFGFLWHYSGLAEGAAPSGPSPTGTPLGVTILVGQGIVFGLTLLLAVPTTRRRRVRTARATADEAPILEGDTDE